VLINGVGIANGESMASSSSNDCALPIITVEPSKTYRLRFIGMTALSMVQFAIVGHENMTIIAADGQYTMPHTESFIQITSGQRFDVVLKTKSLQELGNQSDFYIQFETKNRPQIYHGYGVLRYSNTARGISLQSRPAVPPLTLTNATYDWLEYALEPLNANDFPTAAEVTRRITIYDRQVFVQSRSIVWHMNGLRWNETSNPLPHEIPYLINIYENGQAAIPNYEAALNNSGWDPATNAWPAKIGEVRRNAPATVLNQQLICR
jgi:L-ascorbate oxidase